MTAMEERSRKMTTGSNVAMGRDVAMVGQTAEIDPNSIPVLVPT